MNEKLPFEDAFEKRMNELETPSETESWKKMRALLDKDKSRRPYAFFTRFNLYVIAIFIILAGGIVFYTAEHREAGANTTKPSPGTISKTHAGQNGMQPDSAQKNSEAFKGKKSTNPFDAAINDTDNTSIATDADRIKSVNSNNKETVSAESKAGTATAATKGSVKQWDGNPKTTNNPGRKGRQGLVIGGDNKNTTPDHVDALASNKVGEITRASKNQPRRAPAEARENFDTRNDQQSDAPASTVETTQLMTVVDPRTHFINLSPVTSADLRVADHTAPTIAMHTATDSLRAAASIKNRKHSTKKFFIEAGVGIEQQVPVSGQKMSAYNFNGNKNISSDYIPSLYVKLEKGGRWFVQGEFSYAAPQLVKQFSYKQQSAYNLTSRTFTTNNTFLRKTYYNQLPLNFNYYVKPKWSIGAGVSYNWFHSAVSETQIIVKDSLMKVQAVNRQVVTIKAFTDSFLYKSHTYLMLQTNYSVKRFSFGLRFAKDVQPYIKYTLPGGLVATEKNWTLDLSVRFRLYQSKNFSLFARKR